LGLGPACGWVWGRRAGRNADSPAGEDLEASRRVTLKGRLHPRGPRRRRQCRTRARETQEGTPEEAEHNT